MAEIKKTKTRMYDPWGYQDENNYESSENQFEIELNELFASAVYNGLDKKIHFFNNDGKELSGTSIDTTQFAPGVVKEAYYDSTTKELVIVFDGGSTVRINMAEIIDEHEFGDGLQVGESGTSSSGIVSVKIDSTSDPYLSVSADGIKLSGVEEAINDEKQRAISAETALQEAIDNEIARATSAETILDNKIEAEESRATSAETELQAAIEAEEARATSAETDLQTAIEAEEARATSAESTLNNKIDQEIADRVADVDAEETRATARENAIEAALNAEIVRSTREDELHDDELRILDSRVDLLDSRLGAEETRATTAENTIKAEAFFDADYDSSAKTINFYNKQGQVVDSMDATPFIKDGMIDSVYIDHETKELVIVWNTAAGKEETRIPLSEIFNPEDYYTKAEVDELFNETDTELFRLEELLGHKDNDTLVVNNENEAAFGKYNASHTSEDASGQTIFSIGNGTSNDDRSNLVEVMKNGDVYMWVEGDYMQINRLLGMLAHEVYDDPGNNNNLGD